MSHVVVVGGGIAGLAAAWELTGGGTGPSGSTPAVTLLDAARLGGKLATRAIAGRTVDTGPDGFLARRPEALSLVAELGATGELEPVGAQGAWVLARGRLRRLPPGLAFGVPTRLGDLRTREAIGMLGVTGALRASIDLVAPRPARRSALSDRAIGPLVERKLGRRVVDVLVDPLVGGIHAGRVKDLSAAAVYPPVLEAGQRRGSMMRGLQKAAGNVPPPAPGPVFMTMRGGVGSLPGILEAALVSRGAEVRVESPVVTVRRGEPGSPRWIVETDTSSMQADAVVLAVPPSAASGLLSMLDADASSMVASIDTAGVAVVTLAFDDEAVSLPEGGTGVLVPVGTTRGKETYLTTAVTFLDRKWPHLSREGEQLIRLSAGRIDDLRWAQIDDGALVHRVCEELSELLDVQRAPISSIVARWPHAFPQYRVNHLVRVDGIESAVAALGGVAVAGAAYRGVGIPACIASGRTAARAVRAWLAAQS